MKPKSHKTIKRAVAVKCAFCTGKTEPSYRQADVLKAYVTERGKILGRARTGLCQKHQRRLTIEVKRSRHLARLPFVSRA
jgi:small subunit ribosomal protein S18